MANFPRAIGTLSDYQNYLINTDTNTPHGKSLIQSYPNLNGTLLGAGVGPTGDIWAMVANEFSGDVFFFQEGFDDHADAIRNCVYFIADTPEMIDILVSNMQIDE